MNTVIKIISNLLETLLCVYAIIKYVFKKNLSICSNKNFNIILELFYVAISLLSYTILIVLLLPFAILRLILDIYLRRKHGSKYTGLLKGMDAVWMADSEQSKHIINFLTVVELEKSPEQFVEDYKELIKKSGRGQFNSTIHNILGYWYRLKSDKVLDRVFKVIELSEDERTCKDKFEEKLGSLSNMKLPKDASFEFLLTSQPLSFLNDKNSESNHVLIYRIHHSVTDGINLQRYIRDYLIDRDESEVPEESKKNDFQKTMPNNCTKFISKIPEIIQNVRIYHFTPVESPDENLLHGADLSGEKILTFHIEDEARYVSGVKAIKKRYDGCTFSEVIYAILSASLCKYFKEYDQKNVPENIFMNFITISPKVMEEHDIEDMHSTFCVAALDLPIKLNDAKDEHENLIRRLKIILARNKILKQSIDRLIFYWTSRHCHFLPNWILKPFYKVSLKSTISFSNLPGLDPIKIAGQNIKNIVFWTPNVAKVGVGLAILSYEGRLQIGLTADKALIPSREQAKFIIENFCKYLNLLVEEINPSQ